MFTEIENVMDQAVANATAKVRKANRERWVTEVLVDYEQITIIVHDGEIKFDTIEYLNWWNSYANQPIKLDEIERRVHPDDVLMFGRFEKGINFQELAN